MSRSRTRERRQQKQQANRQRNLILGGVGLLAVVAIAVVIVLVRSSQTPEIVAGIDLDAIPDESVEYPDLGQEHIAVGDSHPDYNSNPPTSGPHANGVDAGVYTEELPDENLIHNLEHGHIWLSYRDADDTEVIEALTDIQAQFPSWIVVTHRPANDDRLVAAAWRRLLPLEEVDADVIGAFILRHRNKAPESVPG